MSGKSVDNAAMCVMSGGVASNTSVVNIGCMDIFSGGVATSTTAADGGCLQVYSGGKANTAILKDGAELTVHAGGVANNITIKDDSSCVCVEEGGKITGVITVSCFNLYTYIAEGAIIDFNISNVAPGEAARVNNLAWLMGWEEEYFDGDYDDDVTCYTVTVSASQESGTYTLAAGAKCFGTTVTVYASTKELGTLSVGKSLTSGDNKYTLKKSGDKLQLAVVGATTAPTVKLSTTKPTNKSITITATFAGNAATKQYSTDNKTWKTYSKAITVSKNGTYYFRSLDKNKKASAVATCKVTNIDTVAPNAPTLKLNTAKAARSVTITATFSKDSSKKQYSTDKKTWKTYGDGLSVTKNGTYYFRGIDAAGNVSTVKSIKVSNIDRVAPAAPTVKASTTSKTKKPVTLTATFSKDSAKKQYSVDNKTWKTYSKAISVSSNGTYYFRGIDAAGNVSNVKSYKVSNITKPTLTVSVKVSNTKFTSGSVTVTATFSSDCTKKQYSLDCGYSWKNYTKPLTLKSCELIEFRGINAAGKKTKVQEVLIDNIMDTGNNKWSNATAAPDYIMTAVNSSYDKVDYYDLGDVENLVIYMERGKIKASFYDGDKNAIKCSTYNAKAEETIASSFTITANEDPDKNSRSFFGISPDVKYLKIEAAASGTNSYYIRNLNYIA